MLKFIRRRRIDHYLFLGDLVGYGASPNEVVQKLAALKPLSLVRGNHDKAVCGLDSIQTFNPIAASAIHWTQEPHHQEELRLPPPGSRRARDVVHERSPSATAPRSTRTTTSSGSSTRPRPSPISRRPSASSATPTSPSSTPKRTRSSKGPSSRANRTRSSSKRASATSSTRARWASPGTGIPMAAFAIYDSDARIVKFYRVEYDIAEAQRKILEAEPPVRAGRAADARHLRARDICDSGIARNSGDVAIPEIRSSVLNPRVLRTSGRHLHC